MKDSSGIRTPSGTDMDVRTAAEQLQGRNLTYTGPDTFYYGKSGQLEIWEDRNCCAPTQDFLVAFVCKDCRKVLSEKDAMEFIPYLK